MGCSIFVGVGVLVEVDVSTFVAVDEGVFEAEAVRERVCEGVAACVFVENSVGSFSTAGITVHAESNSNAKINRREWFVRIARVLQLSGVRIFIRIITT